MFTLDSRLFSKTVAASVNIAIFIEEMRFLKTVNGANLFEGDFDCDKTWIWSPPRVTYRGCDFWCTGRNKSAWPSIHFLPKAAGFPFLFWFLDNKPALWMWLNAFLSLGPIISIPFYMKRSLDLFNGDRISLISIRTYRFQHRLF